jgi:single-strand DNA-binding protein
MNLNNMIVLEGNIGRDAETREVNESSVTSFSLAVNEYLGKGADGQPRERSTWFDVSVWNEYGVALRPHLTKGKKVLVIGRADAPRTFTRNDGTFGVGNRVRAEQIVLSGANLWIITGNLGRDSQLKEANNSNVLSFSVAVNQFLGYDEAGNSRERTEWVNVSLWGDRAVALANSLKKGVRVTVVGNYIEGDAYTSQSGELRVNSKMRADSVQLHARPQNGQSESEDPMGDENEPAPSQENSRLF